MNRFGRSLIFRIFLGFGPNLINKMAGGTLLIDSLLKKKLFFSIIGPTAYFKMTATKYFF